LGVGIIMVAFGAVLEPFSRTALLDGFNQAMNEAFWGSAPLSTLEKSYQQWIYGVLGATMAGWGIFFLFIVRYPFAKKELWARNCLCLGLFI